MRPLSSSAAADGPGPRVLLRLRLIGESLVPQGFVAGAPAEAAR